MPARERSRKLTLPRWRQLAGCVDAAKPAPPGRLP